MNGRQTKARNDMFRAFVCLFAICFSLFYYLLRIDITMMNGVRMAKMAVATVTVPNTSMMCYPFFCVAPEP